MRIPLRTLGALLAGTSLLMYAWAGPADPFTGRWVLDTRASQGGAKSQVLTIDVSGDRESYRSELVMPDGTRQVTTYTARYDEAEYPSTTVITQPNGSTERRNDSVILRKVDGLTRERRWKQHGRIARILRRRVSTDGRTLFSSVIDVDAQGIEHKVGSLVFTRD